MLPHYCQVGEQVEVPHLANTDTYVQEGPYNTYGCEWGLRHPTGAMLIAP